MASLADLIVASDSDAQAIVASEYPLGKYPGVNIDGLNPLHLAALHALTKGAEFDQVLRDYQPIAEASASGPWLIKVHADLIAELANVPPQDLGELAARWARMDQVSGEGWTEEIAEGYLARLIHFSQTASFEGKELFLCAYS